MPSWTGIVNSLTHNLPSGGTLQHGTSLRVSGINQCICSSSDMSVGDFNASATVPSHNTQHIDVSTLSTYKISKQSATMLTFLLSALIHELVMAVVTKKIRWAFFKRQ